MTGSSTVKRISPMLAAADMNETISFYQSVLGFTPTMKSERYSILERGRTDHPLSESGVRGSYEVRPWPY